MAATTTRGPSRPRYSIRTIWGLAKSPELTLDEDTLYALIYRETGKEHMKELSQGQIDQICRVLSSLKDGVKLNQKRTDEGGSAKTVPLRRKIYALTGELGWNDNNARINGFIKKMFGVERIEWLTVPQCHKVIEALKKMVARKEAGNEKEEAHKAGNRAPGGG